MRREMTFCYQCSVCHRILQSHIQNSDNKQVLCPACMLQWRKEASDLDVQSRNIIADQFFVGSYVLGTQKISAAMAAPTAPCAGCEHKAFKSKCELRQSGECKAPRLIGDKYDHTGAWKKYTKRVTY